MTSRVHAAPRGPLSDAIVIADNSSNGCRVYVQVPRRPVSAKSTLVLTAVVSTVRASANGMSTEAITRRLLEQNHA